MVYLLSINIQLGWLTGGEGIGQVGDGALGNKGRECGWDRAVGRGEAGFFFLRAQSRKGRELPDKSLGDAPGGEKPIPAFPLSGLPWLATSVELGQGDRNQSVFFYSYSAQGSSQY
uniref:Uncharacterized protein n=1 Tax=Sphaerodactylus townsendi TaxID=933632 RepID=A0ACB8FL34_9SAUR